MSFPDSVKIIEMGPRDGLQAERRILPAEIKVAFIQLLEKSGLQAVEVGSIVSAEQVPQMADYREVLGSLKVNREVRRFIVIANLRGYRIAKKFGVRNVALLSSVSESFSQNNCHCSVAEGLERCRDILRLTRADGIGSRTHISCAFGGFEDIEKQTTAVQSAAEFLVEAGSEEIVLCDTTGEATTESIRHLLRTLAKTLPRDKLALHLHGNDHQSLKNIETALHLGISRYDTSAAGIGGCPSLSSRSGNVATERLVQLLDSMGIHSGVDLTALCRAGDFIRTHLGAARSITS